MENGNKFQIGNILQYPKLTVGAIARLCGKEGWCSPIRGRKYNTGLRFPTILKHAPSSLARIYKSKYECCQVVISRGYEKNILLSCLQCSKRETRVRPTFSAVRLVVGGARRDELLSPLQP